MVDDVGELHLSLAASLQRVVGTKVQAPSVVIEDACQFAWYRLLRNAMRVERDAVLAWLATTAIHHAIKLARRDQRELSLEARLENIGQLDVPDSTPGPHDQVELRERLHLVRHLPDRQRRLLSMQAIGLSYDEIADEARLSLRTVERQLYRGRSRRRAVAW